MLAKIEVEEKATTQGGDRKKIKHITSKFFLRARGRD